ncbi:MAG: ABC transporter ATP-binding protein [Lentilitoribacter sp.]
MASVTILETQGLSKSFGGLQANTDINFKLQQGLITALIGPNGAGKTTFVGMLCGRIPATSGRVYFNDQDISALPAHQRIQLGIAYTFQITSIFPGLTVARNVELSLRRAKKLKTKDIADGVSQVLAQVNLSDRADQIAGDLSYGHQRILEIAMGLAQDPKLFILDEPTQGLSESEVEEFISLIKSLAGETTILLIEHNMDVVMKSADHIAVLNFGELLAEGSPEEIRQNKSVQSAYLGTSEDA